MEIIKYKKVPEEFQMVSLMLSRDVKMLRRAVRNNNKHNS